MMAGQVRRADSLAFWRRQPHLLVRLLEILVPHGGIVALFETYIDEGDSHDDAPALCVAAYLFETEKCKMLDLEWKAVLDEFELPYFHMVDCVHLSKPFDKLSRDQSIEVEKRMIGIIRDHMLFGAATTVDERDYDTWAARHEIGTAYSYCCWQTIAAVNSWMNSNGLKGDMAYFFESGHDSAGETNAIMNAIAKNEDARQATRYATHAFVCKEKVRSIQTPDILAWLHANHFKRVQRGFSNPRKDYVALVKDRPHKSFIATRDTVDTALINGHPQLDGYKPSWVKKTT